MKNIFFATVFCALLAGYQGNNILVATGADIRGIGGNDVEVVDFSSTNTQTCNIGNYPKTISYGTGALVNDNPMICGGHDASSSQALSECYQYNKETDDWQFVANMASKRVGSASSQVGNNLFVTGGWDQDANRLRTTEFVSPNGTKSSGKPLPSATSAHCQLTLSTDEVIFIGGYPAKQSVIKFNTNTGAHDDLPSLNYERSNAGCALIKNSPRHNLRPIVLSAGGNNEATAEVLDFTGLNPSWEPITNLPPTQHFDSFYGARAVSSVSGQVAVVQHGKHFYRLDIDNNGYTWTILPQKLKKEVYGAVMMTLPDNYTC